MKSSPVFFLRAAYALFLLQSSSSSNCFPLSGTTPIHAPRPRPITYSIGIGTSDFDDGSVDASTQGGPPQLNFSSFLNELSLAGASSPVRQAPVSVLSPVLRRSFTVASPPSARLTVDAGVNAIVTPVDVAVDAVVAASDQAVQAVVEVSESSTSYDPPVEETAIAASSSVPAVRPVLEAALVAASASEVVEPAVDQPAPPVSGAERLEIPEDFSADSLLSGEPDQETAPSSPDLTTAVTSPMRASLLDSDDEPIASRLPGYLSNFKTCEVSDQYLHSFIFLFSFLLAIQIFRLFHLFSIVLVHFAVQFCMLCFFIIFSSLKVFKHGVFLFCLAF